MPASRQCLHLADLCNVEEPTIVLCRDKALAFVAFGRADNRRTFKDEIGSEEAFLILPNEEIDEMGAKRKRSLLGKPEHDRIPRLNDYGESDKGAKPVKEGGRLGSGFPCTAGGNGFSLLPSPLGEGRRALDVHRRRRENPWIEGKRELHVDDSLEISSFGGLVAAA
jgi:hypothetical protein